MTVACCHDQYLHHALEAHPLEEQVCRCSGSGTLVYRVSCLASITLSTTSLSRNALCSTSFECIHSPDFCPLMVGMYIYIVVESRSSRAREADDDL